MRGADLDRDLAGVLVAVPADQPGRAECCLQVGRNARPVTQMAAELGVCWDTVMAAVREHGEPLVDDPDRVGAVGQLGVDETTWLRPPRTTRRSSPPGWSIWSGAS